MNKLTAKQITEREHLTKRLTAAEERVRETITKFNAVQREAFNDVAEAIRVLDTAVTNVDTFRDILATAMGEYHADRSEKWQESEAGETYDGWIGAWEESIESVVIDPPEEIEMPDVWPSAQFAEMPNEPE